MAAQVFNKGDFLKYTSYNGQDESKFAFAIFEGINLAPNFLYSKKLSLALFYDSFKYCQRDNDWSCGPFLEFAQKNKRCEKTIDTLKEDYWWTICTPQEKEKAINILADYGLEWNEDLLSLVDMETGEIVYKIFSPKVEYNGEKIKPIRSELKKLLKDSVKNKQKTTTTLANAYNNAAYGYGYDDYYYD